MSTIQDLARYLSFRLTADGVGTVNLNGFSPADGYMVGGVVTEETFNAVQAGPVWIADFIAAHEGMLESDPELFVGIWLDTSTNMVHLDISERYSAQHEALRVARFRGERAVYSMHNKEELFVTV